MLKIDFCMIVHNGMPFIEWNLEAIYPFANRIIIVEGPVRIMRDLGFGPSSDGTIETVKSFPDPEGKIILESRSDWKEKDDMIRAQEKHFAGNWLFEVDVDEFYHPEDMKMVFKWLESHPECYSMSFRLNTFFGRFDRTIGGFEAEFEVHRLFRLSPGARWLTHRPPTLLWAPTGKTCREMGHADGTKELGVRIYHISHAPPRRMKWKADYYAKLSSSILPGYYDKVYVPWMRARTDEERMAVERQYKGVQEFKPQCRSEAYTLPFTGKLPPVLEKNRCVFEQLINQQCKELGIS
jgi:hypothetical protein